MLKEKSRLRSGFLIYLGKHVVVPCKVRHVVTTLSWVKLIKLYKKTIFT